VFKNTQPTAEPDRESYAVFRKGPCKLEGEESGRLALGVTINIILKSQLIFYKTTVTKLLTL
jgi:hypothetical protein